MAIEIGNADNHTDLLFKLEAFLTTNSELVAAGQNWEVKKDNTIHPYSRDTTPNNDGRLLHRFFIGHGLDGKDNIVVPMYVRENVREDYFSINVYLAKGYSHTQSVHTQPTSNTDGQKLLSLPLWNKPMKYWFIANGRRFIVIAKVSNRYASMYCGFIMPSGTDLEYSYPMYCGATSHREDTRYNASYYEGQGSFFITTHRQAEYTNGALFSPEGYVVYGLNRTDTNVSTFLIHPYYLNVRKRRTAKGNYVLEPIEFIQALRVHQVLGWLDGVYYVSGLENSPENIVTVDGVQYLCIPSFTLQDYNHWAAIRLV